MTKNILLRSRSYWVRRLISRTTFDGSGCWNWSGTKDKDGYGELNITDGGRTSPKTYGFRAHTVSYELFYGPRRDLSVTHRCDNPACWRPDHLRLGTHAYNIADKVAKDRQAKGSRIGTSTLTEDDVRAIRNLRGTLSRRVLSERFGVTIGHIKDIQRRRRDCWKHVI